MLNAPIRKLIAPAFSPVAAALARRGLGADALTVIGFVAGLAAIPVIATHHYWVGLALVLLNRLFDALDGAVARQTRATGRGAFLDMTLDLTVFAGLPFAFALADPSHALASAFFIFAIAASGASAIFFSVLKEGGNLFGYIGRIMEDSELTLAFAIACLVPAWFGVIAYVAGVLCFITAGARIAAAVAQSGEP